MTRRKGSHRWLDEHFSDPYVKRAQRDGNRSRAVYKLEEIDRRDRLFQPGMTIIDLGAAPGGWSEYAASRVGASGRVIALDLLPMEALNGVTLLQGDFREPEVLEQLLSLVGERSVDWVLSDMAPNLSGIKVTDQARAMHLVELALDLAQRVLRPGGGMLVKLFQGEGADQFLNSVRESFAKVLIRKPQASRSRSPEVYVLARNYIIK
ncbi:MAG: 23S rRNA (uridine(2552)-2'-O)-methyltransferase RlmE [Gammaproteobacteria bacterium]